MRISFLIVGIILGLSLTACSTAPTSPDKTAFGGVGGAITGGGAGAVIGHQLSYAGEGLGIGAALGLASGMISGATLDHTESLIAAERSRITTIEAQQEIGRARMMNLEAQLEKIGSAAPAAPLFVYFDIDETSLKLGTVKNIERYAETLKTAHSGQIITVTGHADDGGTPDYNQRLGEARARSVAATIAANGIATDKIKVISSGSTQPVATNTTAEGRQLNRRVEVTIQ